MTDKETVISAGASERHVIATLPFDPLDRTLPRGLRLFGTQCALVGRSLDETATKTPLNEHGDTLFGHALYLAKARTPLFMLEGLARLACATTGEKRTFTAVRVDVKALEDLLGDVDFWWVFLEKSTAWNAPAQVLDWSRRHHHKACGRVEAWLMARAWVDHPYLPQEGEVRLRVNRIGRKLQRVSWPSPRKERQRLAAYLAKRLRDVHRAVGTLDLNDIEHGLHELRRKLRWISIYAAALDGGIQLDTDAKAPRHWDRYLGPAIVNNPFNKLPTPEPGVEPILIPAPLFYALSWIIYELGEIKDRAQWTVTLAEGLGVTGSGADAKPKRWLGDKAISPTEAGAMAARVARKTLIDDRLLIRLADAMEAQA